MKNKIYLCFLAGFFMLIHLSSCNSKPGYIHPPVKDGKVILNIKSLEEMTPVFYSVDLGKARVDFFVVKVKGGIEAYLDACENCYRFRKGYQVEGSEIICRYCRSRYRLDSLKVGLAGCHPMPLKGKVEDGTYVIVLKDIEKAVRFF